MGTTARILHMVLENLQNIRQENHDRCEMLKEILEEYKNMRKSMEDSAQKTQEQSILANNMREEKNKLLREFLQIQTAKKN